MRQLAWQPLPSQKFALCCPKGMGMTSSMLGYLVVFLGGGMGAMLRHTVNRYALVYAPHFPAGTLGINILGCFLMGLATAWFAFRGEDSTQTFRLFLATGILGGFTTFSAFSLDAALLWERGQVAAMMGYMAASVTLSLVAVFVGLGFGRSLFA